MSHTIIGISIEPRRIRIVVTARLKGERVICHAAAVDVAPGPQGLVRSVQQALSGWQVARAEVRCAVCLPNTYVGTVLTPPMPKGELADAIRWEVKEHLSLPPEEIELDYLLREKVRQGDTDKCSWLAAAASRTETERIVAAVGQDNGRQKLRVSHIVPSAMTLEYVLAGAPTLTAGETALVHMGDEVTEISIHRHGQLQYTRRLAVTGDDITASMTKALVSPEGKIELTRSEAQQFQRKFGISRRDSDEILAGKISGKQVYMLIRPQLEKLVNELRRSLSFYEQKCGGVVGTICLSGPAAGMQGLSAYLAGELTLDVRIIDGRPGLRMAPKVAEEFPAFAQEFDLALGTALDRPPPLNLMPRRRSVMISGGQAVGRYLLLSGLVACVSFGYGWARIDAARADDEWRQVRRQYDAVQPRLDGLRAALERATTATAHKDWRSVLQDLSLITSKEILFTEVWTQEDLLYVKGTVSGQRRDGRAELTAFVAQLNKAPCRNAQLIQVRQLPGADKATEFRLTCAAR